MKKQPMVKQSITQSTSKSSTGAAYIHCQDVCKSFMVGQEEVKILKNITVDINKGDFVIIFGPSGCGKSTLLHTLLGLEPPTTGNVTIENRDMYTQSEDDRAIYRRHRVGIIYQQPLWVRSLNVYDNLVLSLHLLDYNQELMHEKAKAALSKVGMEAWANHRPTELSSGQQQKISLARSLIIDPILIVADEPTGNLDTVSGQELIETFTSLNDQGITIIMVTHDLEYLKYANKIIHMIDGQVMEVYDPKKHERFGHTIHGKRGGESEEKVSGPNVRDPEFLKKLTTEV